MEFDDGYPGYLKRTWNRNAGSVLLTINAFKLQFFYGLHNFN